MDCVTLRCAKSNMSLVLYAKNRRNGYHGLCRRQLECPKILNCAETVSTRLHVSIVSISSAVASRYSPLMVKYHSETDFESLCTEPRTMPLYCPPLFSLVAHSQSFGANASKMLNLTTVH